MFVIDFPGIPKVYQQLLRYHKKYKSRDLPLSSRNLQGDTLLVFCTKYRCHWPRLLEVVVLEELQGS